MVMNFFTKFFHKRCPLCKQKVYEQGDSAGPRFGQWYCSEMHADRFALELFESLRPVHCRHSGCHGEHVSLSGAVGIDCSLRQNREVGCLPTNQDRCLAPSLFP